MAGPVRIAILANGSQARREFQQTSTAISRIGSVAKRAAGAGLLVAGAAVAKFGIDSVKAASDAQQSLGATEAVFGKFADTVIKRSNDAAEAVGLSANEYRELANVTGSMLASAGTPLKKVTDLTDQLNRRAADMAATFGGTTKDAVESISALLRGEADPIEKYGVSIKQSDINARLAAKGLDKLEGSARKQAEQTERLALLFDQTKKSAGQFASESDTLAGAQQRLGAKAEDLKAKFGTLLLPVLTDVTNWASNELVPALEDLQKWLADNKDEFAELGGTVKDTLLPPLKTTVDIIGDAIGFFSDLPGPVKTIGIEVGIAALVWPRLSAGITGATGAMTLQIAKLQQLRAEMTYTETRGAALSGGLAKLSGAAKAAAGIGGMVALAESSKQTSNQMKGLTETAGLAATGFAVGGPWGAAIGGGVGLVRGLGRALSGTSGEMSTSVSKSQDYASSLDAISGAATKATRELVLLELQQRGLIEIGSRMGLSSRDLVSSVLGQEGALKRVNKAIRDAGTETTTTVDAFGNARVAYGQMDADAAALKGTLGALTLGIQDDTLAKRKDALATEKLSTVFKGVPKNVLTEFRTGNIPKTRKDVRQLLSLYDLSRKDVQTIVRATGIGKTEKDVKRITRALMDANNTKADLKGWVTGIDTATKKGARYSERDSKLIIKKLEAIKEANPNLAPYVNAVKKSVTKATGEAGKSTKVGRQLKQGLLNGMAGTSSALSAIMSGAVRDAIAAAKKAADSHSPSRKTTKLGRDIGIGLPLGIQKTLPAQRRAGERASITLMQGMAEGVEKGTAPVTRKIDEVTKKIRARLEKQRENLKGVLDGLKSDFSSLSDSIGSAFSGDLFDASETVVDLGDISIVTQTAGQAFTNNLLRKRAEMRQLLTAYKRLVSWGLDPKFLSQLFASGNGALILEMASGTRGKARRDANLFGQVTNLSKKLGNQVAGGELGPRIDRTNSKLDSVIAELRSLNRKNPRDRSDRRVGKRDQPDTHARTAARALDAYQRSTNERSTLSRDIQGLGTKLMSIDGRLQRIEQGQARGNALAEQAPERTAHGVSRELKSHVSDVVKGRF